MILLFPNLDTFRLALTSGTVPAEMALAPAVVSRDDAGRIFVETGGKLGKKTKDELERLKVLGSKRHGGPTEPVASWLQVVPLTADAGVPKLSSQAPVLFELSSPELLPGLVAEMLRLGNDRQGYRTLTDGTGSRVLLRVIGPPYYTLLRALDQLAFEGGTVRAYAEQAPRVWVELGFAHPFAQQIKLDEGQIVLVRPPHQWEYLPDAGFQDVYDVLNFTLPNAASQWAEGQTPARITVPLKLAAGNAADQPEMWVLRGDGVARLDALVRDADDRLTEQLRFAVGTTPEGETVVVLGVAPSKKEPPVLALPDAVAFKSYWRIPNLFLPAGTRLHPTIRRDVVTKLLAEDRDRRVWLFPGEGGTFTPEAIPENAFRPLADWVEYVVGTNAADLREWIAATEFDFENFVCTDTGPKPKPDREKPDRDKRDKDDREKPAEKPAAAKTAGKKTATAFVPVETAVAVAKPPSEWKIRCDELEREFRDADGPLDSPERLALWPPLAEANAALGEERKAEAAICWVNGLWTRPTPELADRWADSETPHAPRTAAELDARLAVPSPSPSQARAVASLFLSVANAKPDWLTPRLPAVQTFLEAHETKLPVRGAWLAAVRLAQLSGGDVLGLARVRDRLLGRLLERGLSAEQDLPTFLRFAGLKNSERLRIVRERLPDVHRAARAWTEASLKAGTGVLPKSESTACTLADLDLMFAYGMAKLGEVTPARTLTEGAGRVLTGQRPDETRGVVAHYLFRVLKFRIENALAGRPNAGPLSAELLDDLESINKKAATSRADDPYKLAHYLINRMREQSEIIDPQEKNDPYATDWIKPTDELNRQLLELPRLKDGRALTKRIEELYKTGAKGGATTKTRFTVLHDVLHLTPRAGQDFAVEMVRQVPRVFAEMAAGGGDVGRAVDQGKLLERAVFLAAYFDQPQLVQTLIDGFIAHVHAKPDQFRFELVNTVAGRSLKSLRKLGLREEIDKLLRRLQDEILKGKTLVQLKAQYAGKPDLWFEALRTALNLAAGWLTFGLLDQAAPILAAARQEILTGGAKVAGQNFGKLCQAYVSALGQGPPDAGLPSILELFTTLDPTRITNTFSSAPYYSRAHLTLAESVVLAVVSDDFALGQAGQQWLDEDEQIVRRRIHADMRDLVKRAGV